MAENRDSGALPPGWDRKYDHRTGRYYYINYFNKTTTWEDPRLRYRQLAQPTPQQVPSSVPESIPMQHGSPDSRGYHVYPSNSSQYPPQPAFQSPAPYSHPSVYFQDLTNVRPSPIPGRAVGPVNPYASPARTVETTMTTDTEQSVAKISAVFPTVSDTHIRALLMKYHNREAVVMSALQVEKHPISTPGPYATPPLQGRHFHAPGGGFSALQMTPPLGIRDSPQAGSPIPRPGSGASGSYIGTPRIGDVYRRPHSSPKMKLRYLKSVFPKVEETLLLDILSNSDNNVQKATEKLIAMGFEKRDTPPPRLTTRKNEEQQKVMQEHRPALPTPPPRMKSLEEKQKMKARLQEKYQDIPERVITIALESVDFNEERACQILNIMVQEEEKNKASEPASVRESQPDEAHPTPQPTVELDAVQGPSPVHRPTTRKAPEKADKGQHRRPKGKKDIPKVSRGTSTTEDKEYKSPYLMKVCGPNRDLYKGPNDELLLADYVTWNGPNIDLLGNGGRSSLAKGPNKSLLQGERSYIAKGPNSELRKGPMRGLAKGSIYSQLTASNGSESRGK
ncbi:hypothetical protein B7P43_G15406 [Cryptotermes secundus]|uniref:WW domain-containing protein n=2 Tax=Cryptotermes secundus TaxID=105785 RepID=A0A2J7QGD7_9NEOP|nr:uncharacterized protein LOC111867722 isoform X1 [Cryptotermes secundus]PNF27644.1 hypothetical protein B7P43_G15406 [Cryptotermes secundus]